MVTMTVEPNPLIAGGTARVCVEFSTAQSGATVQVQIDDGGNLNSSLTITLDDNRKTGCGDWSVPASGWSAAVFHLGDATVSRLIVTL